MAKIALKNHSSLSQMRTVQRASDRVSSWPQWKRSKVLYRSAGSSENNEGRCAEEREQNKNQD